MDQYGPISTYMDLFEHIWSFMELFGPRTYLGLSAYLSQFETLHCICKILLVYYLSLADFHVLKKSLGVLL